MAHSGHFYFNIEIFMYIIYGLKANDEDVIFYIGRRKEAYNRLKTHIYQSKRRKTPCHKKICEILERDAELLEIILHDNLTQEDSFLIERKEISERGRIIKGEGPLVNVTSGGQGSSVPFTEERKALMSKIMKGNTNGRFTKGMKMGNNNAPSKHTFVFNPDGEIISEHLSLAECERHYKIAKGHCSIAIKRGNGFYVNDAFLRFSFSSEKMLKIENLPKNIKMRRKPVILISENSQQIFSSIPEAAKFVSMPVHKLRYAEKNNRLLKTENGSTFKVEFKE